MASALANRYARALVDVVTKPGSPVTPEKILAELADFIAALRASGELRNVLTSPAVSPQKKKFVIEALAARLGLSIVTRNFLRVVIDHRRIPLLEPMLSAYQKLLDERMGIVRADVAAAQPVETEQQSILAARLGELTGKQVRLQLSVDPNLLGGLVARIGSTVYDGSVAGRLRALRSWIVERGP